MTLVDVIGAVGGTLTTLCWLPQVVKVVYRKDTRSISLPAFLTLSVGVVCWVVYGLAIGDVVVAAANIVSLALIVTILIAKLRYG